MEYESCGVLGLQSVGVWGFQYMALAVWGLYVMGLLGCCVWGLQCLRVAFFGSCGVSIGLIFNNNIFSKHLYFGVFCKFDFGILLPPKW